MRNLSPEVISLVNYIELDSAEWWVNVVERLVIAILWQSKNPLNVQQLKSKIKKDFPFTTRTTELNRMLSKLMDEGKIISCENGQYKLSISEERSLNEIEKKNNELASKIENIFCAYVKNKYPGIDAKVIWSLFIEKFLVPLVSAEGARAYDLLVGGKKKINNQSYVDKFIESVPSYAREGIRQVLYDFLDLRDPEIECYLLSYLDAYFTIEASGLPPKVLTELSNIKKENLEFSIFVDTNFVFSILNLHDNPSNEMANDLKELVFSLGKNFNFKFFIRPITLDETRNSIIYHRKALTNLPYPQNLSAAAASSAGISGVFKTYFEKMSRLDRKIDPVLYFKPFEENLTQILEGHGVYLYSDNDASKQTDLTELQMDIENQKRYEDDKYKDGAKSSKKIEHDVTLWHFIQGLRGKKIVNPLQAKYWVVTIDYKFLGFDKFKSEIKSYTPACMHPSQLFQILRFFVPRTPALEKSLLGIMKFPLLARQFDSQSEKISLNIINTLNRHEDIEDIPTDTLTTILADGILRKQLSNIDVHEKEAIALVHEALVRVVAQKDEQLDFRENEIGLLKDTVNTLKTNLEQAEEQKRLLQINTEQIKGEDASQINKLSARIKILEEEKANEKKKRERTGKFLSIGLVGLLGIFLIYFLPSLLTWTWFLNHKNLIGLYICATLLLVGICWTIAEPSKNYKYGIVFGIVAAAIFTIAQIV